MLFIQTQSYYLFLLYLSLSKFELRVEKGMNTRVFASRCRQTWRTVFLLELDSKIFDISLSEQLRDFWILRRVEVCGGKGITFQQLLCSEHYSLVTSLIPQSLQRKIDVSNDFHSNLSWSHSNVWKRVKSLRCVKKECQNTCFPDMAVFFFVE